ncbi:MAG: phosphate/phosphite/phosphonate ABC transporter substrate-binding protein [Nitrospirae bacterium]|nr:phosphate/phosphite/phosphonate ABC transporter substrate-binding protein [Nitrospirota bacterium]
MLRINAPEFVKKSLEFKVLAVVGAILIIGIISAAFMSVVIQRETLYSITGFSSEKTANIIFQDIETTMLEGKADITKKLIANISRIRGIDNITVLNAEGGEAFKEGSPVREASAINELKSGKERLLIREKARLVYYLPLRNTTLCRGCHEAGKSLLGAVRVSVGIEEEYNRAMSLIKIVIFITFFASVGFSLILWLMLRKMVIKPVKSIEAAVTKIAEGDLSFTLEISGDDEIAGVSRLLRGSFLSLERVLLRIKELSDRILKVVEEVEEESEKVLKGAEEEAVATANISSSMEELNATTTEIADNTEDLASSAEDASASIDQMVSSIRHINESIQHLDGTVESTSTSITELSATIKEVADSSGELSVATEETVSAISEIASSIKEVETNARESAVLSEKVTSEAGTLGMASIAKTVEGMNEIASSVKNTANCINALGARSKEIEKILSVIQSVNDETNLLSLNAAILAAQAGEHGRGFSVVAAEMKDLSERTGDSTGDIAALIEAVQQEVGNAEDAMTRGINAVEEGLKLARNTEEALRKVLTSSRKSSEMTLSIKRSTSEQSRAAGQVMENTERVRKMMDNIARATAEQSRGVALITKAAEEMKELSFTVSKATGEQATSSGQISKATELVSEKSRQISMALSEQKKGAAIILESIESVKEIPVQNRDLAFRISATLWNLQKDAELLKAEMERFRFSAQRGDTLRFGVVPLQEPSVMFRKFTPLSEYLNKKLGRTIDLKVAIDMDSAVTDIGTNVTHLCAMGPANYIEANTRYGVKVLAKALRKGVPFHRAAIVVKTDSPLKSLREMKGKSLALVSPKSATGHIMPLAALRDAGITVADLKRHQFLGTHDKVAKAVINGEFDAGGMPEESANKLADKGLRILELTSEIPEFNVCCNPTLDPAVMAAIKDSLVSLDINRSDDAVVLKSLGRDCTGFMPASEKDYDIFREKIQGFDAGAGDDKRLRLKDKGARGHGG